MIAYITVTHTSKMSATATTPQNANNNQTATASPSKQGKIALYDSAPVGPVYQAPVRPAWCSCEYGSCRPDADYKYGPGIGMRCPTALREYMADMR